MFDKDEQEFSQILETGLEAILSGKATLDEVLAENPEQEDLLRPELESALWLFSSRDQIASRPGFIPASRKRVLERIKIEAKNTGAKRAFMGFAWPKRVSLQWVAALVILVMLFTGTGGLVSVSQKAIPGEQLYSVKTASEQVALSLTFNDLKQIQLSDQFSDRRLAEVAALIKNGNLDLVAPTLKAYEKQVNQTIAMLQNASGLPAHEKKVYATALQTDLAQQADEISKMVATAPATLTPGLTQAYDTTLLSSSLAGDVADNTFDPTWTPVVTSTPMPSSTPLPSSTPMPSSTPTIAETATPQPSAAVTPEVNEGNTLGKPSPKPTSTLTPTPENTKRPTITPRPTNVRRPTKKPDPPTPDTKPTAKQDKSTKEIKATKNGN